MWLRPRDPGPEGHGHAQLRKVTAKFAMRTFNSSTIHRWIRCYMCAAAIRARSDDVIKYATPRSALANTPQARDCKRHVPRPSQVLHETVRSGKKRHEAQILSYLIMKEILFSLYVRKAVNLN
jgi:hypothetical protein